MTSRPPGSVDEARRRLTKLGAYAVPAVLTVVAVRSAGAGALSGPGGALGNPQGNPQGNNGAQGNARGNNVLVP